MSNTKQINPSSIDNLLTDIDRTIKKQKICKRNITHSLNSVSELIQNTINDLNNMNDNTTLNGNNNIHHKNNINLNFGNYNPNNNFYLNSNNNNPSTSTNIINGNVNGLKRNESIDHENEDTELKNKLQVLHTNSMNMKALQNILNNNKEYFAYISKLGKDIDKAFNKDVDNIFPETQFNQDLIFNSIYEHFIREGKVNIESAILTELGNKISTMNPKMRNDFICINMILTEIEKKNLDPAIQWATEHELELGTIESDLLFNLHSLKFASIVLESDETLGIIKAVDYAKQNFTKYMTKYMKEIQKLMGSLSHKNRKEHSRYAEIYNNNKWKDISYALICDCCKMQKTTPDSALYLVLTAGNLSLPTFLKYFILASQGAGGQDKHDWKKKNEIPVPTDLGKDFQFHSIFVCPVTKEVITSDNPAMMLKCGHVISEFALKKMLTSVRTKFKCPYCPAELSASSAKPLYFN